MKQQQYALTTIATSRGKPSMFYKGVGIITATTGILAILYAARIVIFP